MSETEPTGVDLIRAALANRSRRLNTSTMTRDLGLPSGTLDGFLEGKALPAETLKALCIDLFQGAAVYDPQVDRLRSAYKHEPRAIHPPPPIWELMELPKFKGGPAERSFRPVKPTPPQPKAHKPGWVD